MKTITKFLLAIPLLAALTVSCKEKPQEPKEPLKITGIEETVEFAAVPDGEVTFTIEASADWSISKTGLDWLVIAPMRGLGKDGAQTVTLSARENDLDQERTGKFTVTSGITTKSFNVTQKAVVVALSATPASLEFVVGGESKTVSIASNIAWTASSSATWATLSAASGKGDATLTVTVAANTGAARTASVTITAGSVEKTVAISQAAFTPTLSVAPASLDFASAGEGKSVAITSNTTWAASASESWVTLSAASGTGDATLTVTAAANTGAARTATVTITAGTLTKTVTVSQAEAPIIPSMEATGLVSGVLSFDGNETVAKTFQVTSNMDWTAAVSNLDWATVTPLSGSKGGAVTITVTPTANSTGAERTGTISFSYGAAAPFVVTIRQAAFTGGSGFENGGIEPGTGVDWTL